MYIVTASLLMSSFSSSLFFLSLFLSCMLDSKWWSCHHFSHLLDPRWRTHCNCHVKVMDKVARKAKIKLVAACLITLVFMIGEVIGEEVAIWNIIVVFPAISLVRVKSTSLITYITYMEIRVCDIESSCFHWTALYRNGCLTLLWQLILLRGKFNLIYLSIFQLKGFEPEWLNLTEMVLWNWKCITEARTLTFGYVGFSIRHIP